MLANTLANYNRPLINATSLHFLTLYKQQKNPCLARVFEEMGPEGLEPRPIGYEPTALTN